MEYSRGYVITDGKMFLGHLLYALDVITWARSASRGELTVKPMSQSDAEILETFKPYPEGIERVEEVS